MLDLMLGSGTDAFSLGEISGWFRLYRHRNDHPLPETWASALELPLEEVEHLLYGPVADFHERAFEVLDVSHLIDSSKEKTWIIDTQHYASLHDYSVFNLLLLKDPVDFAHSFWKRGRYNDWEGVYRRYYEWVLSSGIEFASIKLDDLIQSPASTLHQVCEYIGLSYFPGKERFWEFSHFNIKGSPGVQKQVENGISTIGRRPLSPDFLPLVPEVKERVKLGPIQDLVLNIEQYHINEEINFHRERRTVSHQYRPNFSTSIRNYLHRIAKKRWLRLRHNSRLSPWFHHFDL